MSRWPHLVLNRTYNINAEQYIKWRADQGHEDRSASIRALVDPYGTFPVLYVHDTYKHPVVTWEGSLQKYFCPVDMFLPAKLDKRAISNLLVRM